MNAVFSGLSLVHYMDCESYSICIMGDEAGHRQHGKYPPSSYNRRLEMVDPSAFACSRNRAVATGCPSRFTQAPSLSHVALPWVQTPESCGNRLKRLVLATGTAHYHWLSAQRFHIGCIVVVSRDLDFPPVGTAFRLQVMNGSRQATR
jgi:hypothetical protein